MRTQGPPRAVVRLSPPPRLAIVRSSWHPKVVDQLEAGARDVFAEAGVTMDELPTVTVPGSFEIPLACKHLTEGGTVDGIVALGAIVEGETHHAAEIARACTDGLMRVQLESSIPIAHGVLFVRTLDQAQERSHSSGNRGAEAARTLLQMLATLRGGGRSD